MWITNEFLRAAIERNDLDDVRSKLAQRADPNGSPDAWGNNMLTFAIDNGASLAICQLLLDKGADVNYRFPNPLYRATCRGDLAMCRELIRRGANVNQQDDMGTTALHRAADNGYDTLCALLIDAGASVNQENKRGKTPLHDAATSYADRDQLQKVADVLLSHGASSSHLTSAPLAGDLTPFQSAVSFGNAQLAQYFIERCDEDPRQRTHTGKTMIEIAHDDTRALLATQIIERDVSESVAYNAPAEVDDAPQSVTKPRSLVTGVAL